MRPDTAEFKAVLELHRLAKATLGFLPDAGFADRARSGTLLAALDDRHVLGYVLFDLPRDRVVIRHLCVAQSARGTGVARKLIQNVVDRHSGRRCMSLSCRRDYGVDGMWKRLGFHPVGERTGNSLDGKPLTIWEVDFGHPTLLSLAPTRDLACLDQMVFEDLVVRRPQGAHSRNLRDDWVSEVVELCLTDEVSGESNDTSDQELRRALLSASRSFRNLSRHRAPWKDHLQDVRDSVPAAGDADHRHLARAIEGGATYFVTRDGKVLRGASALRESFGIHVLQPEGLLDLLDRQRRGDEYLPAALQGTALQVERLPAEEVNTFVDALLNTGDGERAHVLRRRVERALANPGTSHVEVVRGDDGSIIAGVVRSVVDAVLEVEVIRVRRVAGLTDTVARQIAFQQRRYAADTALNQIRVTDPHPQPAVQRALGTEWITGQSRRRTCTVSRGVVKGSDLESPPGDKFATSDLERSRWPLKVIDGGLVTWMIAIKPAYAEKLFDARLAAQTLLPREPELGLSRDLVYYRSPGTHTQLTGPARILWYVSQRPPGYPVGEVRAVSHLTEVVVARPRTLFSRYQRLGAWTQEEVEGAAKKNQLAMALRFTDTELLERPITLPQLMKLYEDNGLRVRAPQGPIRVPEHMFRLIYERSSAYA